MCDNSIKFQQTKHWGFPNEDYNLRKLSKDISDTEDSSSCRLISKSYVKEETKEQQNTLIERTRISRRRGHSTSRETFKSSSPSSSIFLAELTVATPDSSKHRDLSYVRSIRKVAGLKLEDKLLVEKDNLSLRVLRKGTKFMKSIKFPTVIIRMVRPNLQQSMMYYVTLEPESEEFVGQIPALMFSNPYCSGKKTDLAELLPLRIKRSKWAEWFSLTPMLLSKGYKKIFSKGCSFKINAVSNGRVVNMSVECPWKLWDLETRKMQKVIIDIISGDIRQIPKNMLRALTPLKRKKTFTKLGLNSGEASHRSPKETVKVSEESSESRLSDYCGDLKFTGLTAKGGFAEWFKILPPNIRVDQNFRCNRGTILMKDNFSDMQMFQEYLCISDNI